MIIGHGIDLQSVSAIWKVQERHPRFAKKVLTEKEYQRFSSLKGKRQMEYLAGRWAAKEAFVKAMGTGITTVGFRDVEILTDSKGAPYIAHSPVPCQAWVSISHSADFVQASVILEDKDETK